MLFDKYLPETLAHLKGTFLYIVPVVQISLVINLCKLLESILDHQQVLGLEFLFVFCAIWSIGAGFAEKGGRDFRKDFSSWWKDKFKVIKFPARGTVFDYYVDL